MSVIINDTFSSKIREQLLLDINDNHLIESWFVRIITIRFLEVNNLIKKIINYTKEEIINCCIEENRLLPNIFIDNLTELSSNYPTHFYEPHIIELINSTITIKTDIERIIYWQEEFKNHERLIEFTSTNRNSDTVVNQENITAVTQIFTPKWIAKYMIHSSIGNNDQYTLTNNSIANYNKIKILDPCMGVGQLLVEVFEYLLEKNDFNNANNKEDIIYNIYTNQLYGFDIDNNVVILSKFMFLMKAIKLCPNYIKKYNNVPNFVCIKKFNISSNNETIKNLAKYYKEASLCGSLIRIPKYDYDEILKLDLNKDEKELVYLSKLLNQKYDLVITNPPYMGRKVLPKELLNYLNDNFKYGKSELYTSFMERCLKFLSVDGTLAMLTLHTWMFIKSFANLRKYIINNYHLSSLVHLGKNTFENLNAYNALASAFIIKTKNPSKDSIFVKLDNYDDIYIKEKEFFNNHNHISFNQNKFLTYTDAPLLYWLSKHERLLLQQSPKLASCSEIRQGLATGNNELYVRDWYEVDVSSIGFNYDSIESFHNSGKTYAPYNKGGDKTKWYSTSKTVIKFNKDTYEKLKNVGNHLPSRQYYFKEGITWSLFGFNSFNVRYKEEGYVFDVSGSSLFCDKEMMNYILAFLSSNVAFYFLAAIAPTVNFQVGNIASLPFIYDLDLLSTINETVDKLIDISKQIDMCDELSWHYKQHPLVDIYDNKKTFIENVETYANIYYGLNMQVVKYEEKINTIFNQIYQTNISAKSSTNPKVLTVQEIIYDFISYLVGVVFGRFNLYDYHNNIDNSKFINTNDIVCEIEKILDQYFDINTKDEITRCIHNSLKNYIDNNFGKKHMIKYMKKPIYWYKKIDDNTYVAYYHTLKELDIDKDLTIKTNYRKYNLLYKI